MRGRARRPGRALPGRPAREGCAMAGGGDGGDGGELADLRARVHRGIGTIECPGPGPAGSAPRTVPSIEVAPELFARIMRSVAGRPFTIDTDLDILQDGLGHVFVYVSLGFGQTGIRERFLVDASESYEFFDLLAETSMLAVSPEGGAEAAGGPAGAGDVILVQLPRPERAAESLGIIRRGLAAGGSGGGGRGRQGAGPGAD